METQEITYDTLCENLNKYIKDSDIVERAYRYAQEAHKNQKRRSGEAYIVHPLSVACILAEMEMDPECIAAGLLHDVIEDVEVATYEIIESEFSKTIADLVEGVTKLDKIPFGSIEDRQVENARKMIFAMASDIRVIIIKLADRLHNMRTLKYMPEEKQLRISKETLDIYAPLAHRLGLSRIKWELEDLALRYLDSVAYFEIVDSVTLKMKEREDFVEKIIALFNNKLDGMHIKGEIKGRVKHYYSIYRKMFTQNKTIDEIYDLYAVRIIVKDLNDCYAALGMVHELFTPIPGRVKDYIAIPKPNMYQSLHTTLIGPDGIPFEVQIRTWEMHQIAENGIAAHWKYKEGKVSGKVDENDAKLSWVKDMLEIQKDADSTEFMNMLKIDMFSDEVFVFTPKGDVRSLPAGATPVDMAFAIHSAIGYKMTGAKVNSKIVPIDYTLQNGDIVEIVTSSVTKGPKLDWIKICKTTSAKNKINQWFKKEKREENIEKGKDLIEKEIKKQGFTTAEVLISEAIEQALVKFVFNTLDDLYANVGCGTVSPIRVTQKLIDYNPQLKAKIQEAELAEKLAQQQQKIANQKKKSSSSNGIIVKGEENLLVRLSKCCSPVPGDDIVGFITRGRGVSVHRKDCVNIKNAFGSELSRLIECDWDSDERASFDCHIIIHASDRRGLLAEITICLSELKLEIMSLNATNKNNVAVVDCVINISDVSQIELMSKKLHMIPGIYDVIRA